MPSFAATGVIGFEAERIFAVLAEGESLGGWGGGPDGRLSVTHVAGPPAGEGATFRVLERLGHSATANYRFTITDCERPRALSMRSARVYDRSFLLEPLGPALTRVTAVREYPDRPSHLLARVLGGAADAGQAEAAIRRDLSRLSRLLGGSPPARIPLAPPRRAGLRAV